MKKIFSFILLMLISVVLCWPAVVSVAPARAATVATPAKQQSWVDTTSNPECANKGNCNPCDLVAVLIRYANGMFMATGAMAMFMFAFGGIVMLTAYGNESRITAGKNVIMATVVGMFIIFTAWTLTNVFIGAFFGMPSSGEAMPIFGHGWNVCVVSAK